MHYLKHKDNHYFGWFSLEHLLFDLNVSLIAKNTSQREKSRGKVWSPYEFGSIGINWNIRNLRNLRNSFQNTRGNIKPPRSAESKKVTPFHVVKAYFNQLFR